MPSILVVDDQASVRFTLREILSDAGYEVLEARDGSEALTRVADADLVVTDFAMPGISGLELLASIRAHHSGLPVIMLTARGSEETAVLALKAGAADYLVKPANVDALCLAVERALQMATLRRDNRVLRAGHDSAFIGESAATKALLRLVERVGQRDMNVLVRGETGTGKERIAGLLHAHSPREAAPLVRFNCGAVPDALAASELFGHVRGSFTGADRDRDGYFQAADGGTLVLDEIAELPLGLQPLLLRALEQGEVQRVGSTKVERVDVRIVACTHADLRAKAAEGTFREDLYFRIAAFELEVPPLRDRPEDIELLAEYFVERYRERYGMESTELGEEARAWLRRQPWSGNVRELENCIVRMMALSETGVLMPPSHASPEAKREGPLRARMAAYETQILRETMRATNGNQSEAARRLGVTRVTLIDKLKRYGLKK